MVPTLYIFQIRSIPETIINLSTLERFDISNNDLSTLPPTLGTLPHLKSLQVDGNPMKAIRRDILQRGTTELMKFLRSEKLLFLGQLLSCQFCPYLRVLLSRRRCHLGVLLNVDNATSGCS
jgi:Leucine-rich repeat (LRR) protein